MTKVLSKDGTDIAFEQFGEGQPVILVVGAFNDRSTGAPLAAQLAPHFSVFTYDRRGRGESGDTAPYAVEREIEDIAAVIGEAGGSAALYGHSSGACLALEAALALGSVQVTKLAMYEAPYDDDPAAREGWERYLAEMTVALADGRPGDAAALFMTFVGTPADQIESMRQAPFWPGIEAVAPTLAYDHAALMGKDRAVPAGRAARITVPVLVMHGEDGAPFMAETARTLARTIPGAKLRTLAGEGHNVSAQALAPLLAEFANV